MSSKSVEELLSRYQAPATRESLLRTLDLGALLGGCILGKDYVVPDELNAAIELTEHGKNVQRQLMRSAKDVYSAKDVRVSLFLATYDEDLLVDLKKTDFDALEKSIAVQMKSRRIFIPPRLGRDLYDQAASLHDFATPDLSHSETLELLERCPVGVTQVGKTLFGPLGRMASSEERWLLPEREVPLFHCHKLHCRRVHITRLSTDHASKVNLASDQVNRRIAGLRPAVTPWEEFIRQISESRAKQANDDATGGLPYLLMEALSTEELRLLITYLLDHTGGELRATLELWIDKPVLRAMDFTQSLNSQELLQVALLAQDSTIIRCLDELVWEGPRGESGGESSRIVVPRGEVRKLTINRSARFGAFELHPQLGQYGVRFKPAPGVAHLRLHRLIDQLYPPTEGNERALEFDWQFRESAAEERERKQDEVLRSKAPRPLVRQVVLSSHSNVIITQEKLNLIESGDDDSLVSQILWKLGFPLDEAEDATEGFRRSHLQMESLAETATIGVGVSDEAIRKEAGEYFTQLEKSLDDSLFFATWILLADHLSLPDPFHYRPALDRDIGIRLLNEYSHLSSTTDPEGQPISFSDRNTLFPLIQGFRVLSDIVQKLANSGDEAVRDVGSLPVSPYGSDLRRYPFVHSRLLHDVTPSSRESVIEGLRSVHERLTSGSVAEVRNSWLHYRRETADRTKLNDCLTQAMSAVKKLDELGLTRCLYLPGITQIDSFDRLERELFASGGRSVRIAGPTRLDLGNLPDLVEPQYVVSGLALSEAGDVMRIGLKIESSYSAHWQEYPRRRTPSAGPELGTRSNDLEGNDGVRGFRQ